MSNNISQKNFLNISIIVFLIVSVWVYAAGLQFEGGTITQVAPTTRVVKLGGW